MANHYEIPSWAGKPPTGLHLDVMKENKLIQKLMIDDKRCYLFGRNAQLCDFCIDHQSCSRVHAALVYHKHLDRAFLVDLGSTHGTYIGSVRIEGHKPTQLPIDTTFHFGASTRMYIIRERPQTGNRPIMEELEKSSAVDGKTDGGGGLLGLPESETELDNLTEFNTAHNRRITMLGIPDEKPTTAAVGGPSSTPGKKRKKPRIVFAEEDDIINPEDIDPSVGRFRNLVETTVIPKKRPRMELGLMGNSGTNLTSKRNTHFSITSPSKGVSHGGGLYDDMGPTVGGLISTSLSSKLGLPLPNPAPDIEMTDETENYRRNSKSKTTVTSAAAVSSHHIDMEDTDEPKKKKYAKEAWPGKKPTPSLLI